jgi:uncharacterized membrane protein
MKYPQKRGLRAYMKNNRIAGLIILVVLAFGLATISAFANAGTSTPATYPSATAAGTNGYYPNGMTGGDWSGMMSGMMGGNWGPSLSAQNTGLLLVGFITLIGVAVSGVGGAAYYLGVPKIRRNAPIALSTIETYPQSAVSNVVTPYVSVSKTLTDEERKVLDVLVSHNGKYLQKYIRAETGLSRLKIHRIVSRLAERGIVTLQQSGNTNEVQISSWLQNKPHMKNDGQKENQELTVEA